MPRFNRSDLITRRSLEKQLGERFPDGVQIRGTNPYIYVLVKENDSWKRITPIGAMSNSPADALKAALKELGPIRILFARNPDNHEWENLGNYNPVVHQKYLDMGWSTLKGK